jgi:hypothetical protein
MPTRLCPTVLSIAAAAVVLTLSGTAFAQTTPETAPAERDHVPESARDPQVMVPPKADDVDHTKEDRDRAAKRGAVKSVIPPTSAPGNPDDARKP